jgi:hypothetical protein
MVLPDRIELSTSPLPTVRSKVKSACAAGFFELHILTARILHGFSSNGISAYTARVFCVLGSDPKLEVPVPQWFLNFRPLH